MERKWYRYESEAWVEAPNSKEIANGVMFNYNCDANETMLRADGYIPENEVSEVINEPQTKTLSERVEDIEQVTEEIIATLNDKNIIP